MRLFFGLSLPGAVHQAVCDRAAACRKVIDGRYVREENYHMTLAFLGDVPENRVQDAAEALRRCISQAPAPRLTLGETSYFGRADNAILIVRVTSDPSLDPLHDALVQTLDEATLPFDPGPFSPHITLARHARAEGIALPSGPSLSFIPSSAHLYLSARNAQDILTYTPITTVFFRS